jgi:hypothetical protein
VVLRSNTCPKCGGRMGQGYLPEYTQHHSRIVPHWIEGAPERGWFGLKVRGKRKLEVETWRCEKCAYLENYAPAP